MTAPFKKGDRVWFISKFGDRVTGVYDGPSTIPGVGGTIHGHTVISDNAFGPDTNMKGARCFVTDGLRHEV